MAKLAYCDLHRIGYDQAAQLQQRLVRKMIDHRDDPKCDRAVLLLCEHEPVITLGRAADEKHVLANPSKLEELGIQLVKTSRGGDVTYHGPGQIVGYPIMRLDCRGRNVHGFIRNLEEVIIQVLAELGVSAQRQQGLTGVWVGNEKVAAIGIAVSRWISYHGFSINVQGPLPGFGLIVPCGISDRGVTSISKILGMEVSIEQVKPLILEKFAQIMNFDQIEAILSVENLFND